MAPSTPSASGGKQMSSRLLTMKFMQRASATSPTTSQPSTPLSKISSSNTAAQDSTPPSSKRSKLSHPPTNSEATNLYTPTNAADVKAAIAQAEAVRQAALERSWNGEETKWSFAVRNGMAEKPDAGLRVEVLDWRRPEHLQNDSDAEETTTTWRNESGQGRQVFGQRKRKYIPPKDNTANKKDDEADASENSDDSSMDSDESLDEQARKILDTPDSGFQRKGGLSGRAPTQNSMECHNCHETGHKARDCPNKKKSTKYHHKQMAKRYKG